MIGNIKKEEVQNYARIQYSNNKASFTDRLESVNGIKNLVKNFQLLQVKRSSQI